MDEDQDQVFARQNVTEEQNTKAIDSILYMVCSLTANQDQATIQAGCQALGQMIKVEQTAKTE